MTRPLPTYAIVLGLAGLLPFVACGFGALALQDEWAERSLLALLAYGATILAFLGGVHWGLALLDASVDERVQQLRFGLGVVPSLVGWSALLLAFFGWFQTGLLLLTAGFVAVTAVEARATRYGLMPKSYMRLRWVLSGGVLMCLASVLLVRVFGGRIVL